MSSPTSPVFNPSQSAAHGAALETPLLGSLLSATPNLGIAEYHGVRTVSSFTTPPQELAAMLTGAGIFDMGWRTQLRCTGEDRARWLNGMVTNHVGALSEDSGCYSFVLNAQGRIQGDLNIYRQANALLLDTDVSQAATLLAFLDRYIIMDDVVLEPSPALSRLGIAGPKAAAMLAKLGIDSAGLQPLQLQTQSWQGHPVTLAAAHSPQVPRLELWIAPDHIHPLWQSLLDAGAMPCGSVAIEQLRILEGTPAYGTDLTARDLPQETNQTRALHFAKGCYLGQEIVERIRSRGNVHRSFSGFKIGANFNRPEPSPIEKIPILSEGTSVGEITSAANIQLPDGPQQIFALGYIRREALDRKVELQANGAVVTPGRLPFLSHENTTNQH